MRDTDHAPRLENLKPNLKTAYKMARDYARESHANNKRYYDRSAKEREFSVGDFVYLYNPAVKAGVSAKFRRPWTGPWRITDRKSQLNYEIMNQQGKHVVHVNRLKRAYNRVDWQEPKKGKLGKEVRPKRRQPEEEEEQEVSSPGPILSRAPMVEDRQPEHRSPVRDRQVLDTPTPGPSPQEAPSNHRLDPTYGPLDTPRSRREMGVTRENPPLTRLRSRMQTLQKESENEPQL